MNSRYIPKPGDKVILNCADYNTARKIENMIGVITTKDDTKVNLWHVQLDNGYEDLFWYGHGTYHDEFEPYSVQLEVFNES